MSAPATASTEAACHAEHRQQGCRERSIDHRKLVADHLRTGKFPQPMEAQVRRAWLRKPVCPSCWQTAPGCSSPGQLAALERSAIGWRGSARKSAARALSDGRPSPVSPDVRAISPERHASDACVAQSKGGAVWPPALRRRPAIAIHTQFTGQMLLFLATAQC
jgi:hypothetical protein